MSILRRKGKQFKDNRRRDREVHGAKYNSELLSSDILTLIKVFHDEAFAGDVSSPSCQTKSIASLFRDEIDPSTPWTTIKSRRNQR